MLDASTLITNRIKELTDWRGERLAEIRKLILSSSPSLKEEWKWDTAVWTQNGLICAAGAFKDHLKLNFFQGAMLNDKNKLFNAGLEAKKTRAIDFYENDKLDLPALKELILEAISYNASGN